MYRYVKKNMRPPESSPKEGGRCCIHRQDEAGRIEPKRSLLAAFIVERRPAELRPKEGGRYSEVAKININDINF
jgi:hypothetical protein